MQTHPVQLITGPSFLARRSLPTPPELPAADALNTALLADRTPQKNETPLATPQVHPPGLLRMQWQTQPVHHQLDPPKRFPGRRLRPAHRNEIVGIVNQFAELATARRPAPVQLVQVNVGQQRRDHSTLRLADQGANSSCITAYTGASFAVHPTESKSR
jgi:hypothetical protein